jgi:uncharacterized protein
MSAGTLPRATSVGRQTAAARRVTTVFGPAAMRALFAVFLITTLASNLWALDVPPPPAQWYNDPAGLLDSSQAAALNTKLRDFEQKSGAQMIFYVFPSLEQESLEDFTIHCAEKWKVGNKKYDNGLILFVFKQEKKLRIEVGYGLEPTITDAVSSDVIRNDIAPRFKEGDFAGGLNAAADDLMSRISGGNAAVAPVNNPRSSKDSSGESGQFFIFVIVMIFLFFILPVMRRSRRAGRGSGCGGCFWPMFFLGGSGGGGTFGGGGFSGGGGGGGFSGGGGGFGGGGASGGW